MFTKQLTGLQNPNWMSCWGYASTGKATPDLARKSQKRLAPLVLTYLELLIPLDSLCENLNCTVNVLFMTVHCHQCRHLQTNIQEQLIAYLQTSCIARESEVKWWHFLKPAPMWALCSIPKSQLWQQTGYPGKTFLPRFLPKKYPHQSFSYSTSSRLHSQKELPCLSTFFACTGHNFIRNPFSSPMLYPNSH